MFDTVKALRDRAESTSLWIFCGVPTSCSKLVKDEPKIPVTITSQNPKDGWLCLKNDGYRRVARRCKIGRASSSYAPRYATNQGAIGQHQSRRRPDSRRESPAARNAPIGTDREPCENRLGGCDNRSP